VIEADDAGEQKRSRPDRKRARPITNHVRFEWKRSRLDLERYIPSVTPSPLPIVFLPGGGGRSSFWRPVADRLWRRGAPIVLGYPGFGDVPRDPSIGTLDDYFAALTEALPERFHVVAQSMGNVLALRMALEAPSRVASLTLCALSGGIDVSSLGAEDWRASFRSEHPHLPTWFVDDRSDFTDRLSSLRIPTLALSGGADPLSPVGVGEFLRDRIAGALLDVFEGGTHWVAHESPDQVSLRIARFLS
jgi:pimeloyl-ACP methyl ester carboxylesterase